MKKIILLIALVITSSQAGNKSKVVDFKGERLEYKVSFLGVNLGKIELGIIGDTTLSGERQVIAFSKIASADGIPFVSLKADFKSYMNEKITNSQRFFSVKETKKGDLQQETIYDYENNNMVFKEWMDDKKFNETDHDIKNKFNDGTSLFFFARKYAGIGRTIKVPTMVDTLPGVTVLNFTTKTENVEIDAVDYPIKTSYLDGEALWDGIYGLSGKFEGWFSDDEASIPIKAKMNVYVGSVLIELVKWERGSWSPPKAD